MANFDQRLKYAKKQSQIRKAAPALLEALEELMSEFEAYAERIDAEVGRLRDFDRMISDGDVPECYNKAKAAIAAARGE